MKAIKRKLKAAGGFTLVELVVVIAVLAILAGVGSVAYRGYITRAQEAKDMNVLAAVKTAVDAARAENENPLTSITVAADGTVTTNPVIVAGTNEQKLYDEFMEGVQDASSKKVKVTKAWVWTSASGEWQPAS